MSGLARKLKRALLREKFNYFTKAWHNEVTYQKFLMNSDEAIVREETLADGRKVKIIQHGEKQMEVLGKKPPFGRWMKTYEAAEQARKKAAFDEKKVEVSDTEW